MFNPRISFSVNKHHSVNECKKQSVSGPVVVVGVMKLLKTEKYDHLKDHQVVRVKQLQQSPGGSCQISECGGTDGALAACPRPHVPVSSNEVGRMEVTMDC